MPEPLGQPRLRVDGVDKITGNALYAADSAVPGMAHAVLVQSSIARGKIAGIDTAEAQSAPGVLAIFTHENLPPLQPPPEQFTRDFPAERRPPLSDNVIHYAGQHVALVAAEIFEQAQQAAALVRVEYRVETPTLDLRARLPGAYRPDHFATLSEEKLQAERGTPGAAAHTVAADYETPVLTHNPLEPSATLAIWQGDRLTLHDSTRWVQGSRKLVAAMLGLPEDHVRVLCPFTGGAFGSKSFLWQHVALVAQAARALNRPLRLVLTRQQMFTSVGHRPRTRQHLVAGADRNGRLTTVQHSTLTETSPVAHFCEPAGLTSRNLYRTPHVKISHEVAPTNIATPCFMRAPGESPGIFALESAIDELAEACGLDPLEFRLRNYAERDLHSNRRWSSKHLDRCYRIGAGQFGWSRRTPAPGSMQRDGKLVGWGMATAAYPGRRSPATVRGTVDRSGVATFSAATHAIGCGASTLMEQIAASALGFPMECVRFELGDSSLSQAPVTGASQTTASVGSAVYAAARALRRVLLETASADPKSAFYGLDPVLLTLSNGRIQHKSGKSTLEPVSTVLARMAQDELCVESPAKPDEERKKQFTFHSFGVHFAEVEFDPGLAELRVTRWVAVMDIGRVLNPRTARSQIMGGIVMGLGMALMEGTVYDPGTGAPVNANLADYLVPTCADSPAIDVHFLDEPDLTLDPLGARGLGEIGITGVPAAIANAVYHASGIRVRELPITIEKLLAPAARAATERRAA